MPLVNLQSLLDQARSHGFAVPAWPVDSLDDLTLALRLAQQADAPLVLQLSATTAGSAGFAVLLAAVELAAQQAEQPLALLHRATPDLDAAVAAIRYGCNGLLMAPSVADALTDVAVMARGCGIPVGACLTAVDSQAMARQARALLAQGADFVAVDGRHPMPASAWRTLANSIDRPLLLSDARGQPDGLDAVAAAGLALIGLGGAGGEATDETLVAAVAACGASGRARQLLARCEPLCPVEHLILYNLTEQAAARADAIMARGREVLAQIPGVRRVVTGSAVQDGARYRLCWLVRFCDPAVIASYRDHPLHVAFADEWFRPYAADRVSIDYLLDGA